MKFTFTLSVLIIWFCLNSLAQSPPIKIELFLEDETMKSSNELDISFVKDKDTIKAVSIDDTFIIPKELADTKVTTIFCVNKYKLIFSSLNLIWNPKLPLWKIYIDTKPFNKERTGWLKDLKTRRKVKIIYMLDNGVGGATSEYRYKIKYVYQTK